ncbi:hypothetical protein J580_0884 [Acinetobacter sp. 1542444]|nr:hypothetical protein J580_0884 [Acinetobacter sp. 1542444]EXS13363.1 hypothetical protein J672_2987 [Acinetobacter sp. 883425]
MSILTSTLSSYNVSYLKPCISKVKIIFFLKMTNFNNPKSFVN